MRNMIVLGLAIVIHREKSKAPGPLRKTLLTYIQLYIQNSAFDEFNLIYSIILQRTLPSETTFERIHSASWYQDLM